MYLSIAKIKYDKYKKIEYIHDYLDNLIDKRLYDEIIKFFDKISRRDNSYYKRLIVEYIKEHGNTSRKEINKLIYPLLPDNINKNNKVKYLLNILKDEKIIKKIESGNKSSWKII